MSLHPPAIHPAHPLKLVGLLCLGWTGTAMFVVGLVVLGKDAYTWLVYGGRLDLTLTSVFVILSPFLSPTVSHAGGLVEFSRVAPLSLVLMALGWCCHQLARGSRHVAQEMARPD